MQLCLELCCEDWFSHTYDLRRALIINLFFTLSKTTFPINTVPLPRIHLIRYSGVLAPNATMRKGIIPGKTRAQIKAEQEEKNKDEKPTLLQKSSWAKLLAKVFEIDISKCFCGGNLKIISVIRDPFAIRKILSHLGLSPQPPPIAPARYGEDIFIS